MNILYFYTSQNVLITGVLKGAENFPRSLDAGKNGHTRLLMGEIDAALAASLFHFGELGIAELKDYLQKEGVVVRR